MTDEDEPPRILFNRFEVKERLGKGSFGKIYKVIDTQSQKQLAVKMEKQRAKGDEKKAPAQLEGEARVYQAMRDTLIDGGVRWPSFYLYKSEGPYNYLLMDLLGSDLDHVMQQMPKKCFTVSCTAFLAQKMITLLERMHSKGFVHRDLKPQNFVLPQCSDLRRLKAPPVYLIDYGLTRRYRKSDSEHLDFEQTKPLKGTVRFSSINTHLGTEQTRRDDFQALGYILVYFMLGRLPWQNMLNAQDKKEGYHLIMVKKMMTTFEALVSPLPETIRDVMLCYLFYVNSLAYHERPDYDYCRQLFSKAAARFSGHFA